MKPKRKRRALFSAFRKSGELINFADELRRLDWMILASGGTKRFLHDHNIPSMDIGTIVGKPILQGRVKTLDQRVHGSLLSRLEDQSDIVELRELNMRSTELVFVDLYPLGEELKRPGHTFDSVLEKIDMGGVALLRSAAKGMRIVVSSPDQFESVLRVIKHGPIASWGIQWPRKFLCTLAARAEETAAAHARLAAEFYQSVADGTFSEEPIRRAV